MKSLWESLYDRAKDRRYATLFLMSLALFFGCLPLGVWISQNSSDEFLSIALPLATLCFGAWTAFSFRRAFFQRPERCDFPKLSSDERRVARSKLKNEMKKRFGHTTPRAPDVDLKY